MNPMVGKELRQRMREKRGWILPSLYLLALGGVVALAYYIIVSEAQQVGSELQGAAIGVPIFIAVTYTQLSLLLLLAPVFSAGLVTIEKEQRTLAGLLTSLLTTWQIWWGKFTASLLFLMLLLVSSLPVLSLTFAFGGISPRQVGVVALTSLLVFAVTCAIGLYCSSFFRRSIHATAVTYGILVAMTLLTFIVFLLLQAYHQPPNVATTGPDRGAMIALYLNPYFLVSMAFARQTEWYPDWFISLGAFLALGIIATLLALYNLRRAGEQS
jgi:ABC-2 type transport system permease protein